MSKLINFFWLYPKAISAVVLIVLIAGGFIYIRSGNGEATIKVERQDLVQTIQASGKVRATGQVDLSFAKSGRVAQVNKQPGQAVYAGEVIAALDQADLLADRQSAQATLKQNEAKVASAKVALTDAKLSLDNRWRETYTVADTAVRSDTDQFFDNPRTAGTVFNVGGTNQLELRGELGITRIAIEHKLNQWLVELNDNNLGLDAKITKAKNNLRDISIFLDKISLVLNDLPDLESQKTVLSGARNDVNSVISSLSTSYEKYRAAAADIAVQEAAIESARAEIAKIDAEIGKGLIKAPLSGLVTKQEATVGESVEANVVVTSVIANNNQFEIEAFIPEVNIAKVSIGNQVKITFDALPGETFTGTVTVIDQGETIRDGVPNFKTKVLVKSGDKRIKTGLSANLTIETAKKESVLVVPVYVLSKNSDDKTIVKVQTDKQISEREIVVGATGDGGLIEVVSGLELGEVIIATPEVE